MKFRDGNLAPRKTYIQEGVLQYMIGRYILSGHKSG